LAKDESFFHDINTLYKVNPYKEIESNLINDHYILKKKVFYKKSETKVKTLLSSSMLSINRSSLIAPNLPKKLQQKEESIVHENSNLGLLNYDVLEDSKHKFLNRSLNFNIFSDKANFRNLSPNTKRRNILACKMRSIRRVYKAEENE